MAVPAIVMALALGPMLLGLAIPAIIPLPVFLHRLCR